LKLPEVSEQWGFIWLFLVVILVLTAPAVSPPAKGAYDDEAYLPPNGAHDVRTENLVFSWPAQSAGYLPEYSQASNLPEDDANIKYYSSHAETSSVTSDDPGASNDMIQSSASYYRLMLASDPEMKDVVLDTTVYGTVFLMPGPLKPAQSYYWRVMPVQPVPGDWSSMRFFYTGTGTPSAAATINKEKPMPVWAIVTIALGSVMIIVILALVFTDARWRT